MDNSIMLDGDELLHLALHAIQHDEPDKAIGLLRRLLKLQPENGKAHYLLGALHAEIGMHDKAAEEMTHALKLEPGMATARFQLGLLHLTSGKIAEAEAVWEGLDLLGEQDPLYLFKKGMLHLVRDEFESCVKELSRGIELNTLNEDLNNDMRRVLADAEKVLMREAISTEKVHDEDRTNDGKRMLLSLYENHDAD